MKVTESSLPGVLIIEPKIYPDNRGFFLETYNENKYRESGLDVSFVQDNLSRSRKGTLRGLHYQLRQPQGKLVRVTKGEVFDVAVDIRRESESFAQWFGLVLSEENQKQLYIPPGYAHGFYVLSDEVDFQYKCTDYYAPGDEYGIRWDDPSINITWPDGERILSEKDKMLPFINDISENLAGIGSGL